jgi:hypothetical protein
MTLTAEQIQANWDEFLGYIETHISSPRKEKLTEFYKKYEDRLILMPASHKVQYHNCFPGGYVDHVNRVVKGALATHKVWEEFEADITTYTIEELVFSAINHDLGKMGDADHEAYLPQTDNWRKNNLGEMYTHNKQLPFLSVPDRGLHMLQSHGISYTTNEMLTIKLHDGLYDPANEPYLKNWMPETKPRTSLVYILHQADMMAARIEFEKEYLPKFKISSGGGNFKIQDKKTNKKTPIKVKALSSVPKNDNLKGVIDKFFE